MVDLHYMLIHDDDDDRLECSIMMIDRDDRS